jgi:hypothetical protein
MFVSGKYTCKNRAKPGIYAELAGNFPRTIILSAEGKRFFSTFPRNSSSSAPEEILEVFRFIL